MNGIGSHDGAAMAFISVKGKCKNCLIDYSGFLSEYSSGLKCKNCREFVISARVAEGCIYIASVGGKSPVKIGKTTNLDQRIRSLSTTGVIGKFRAHAVFPSFDLNLDEDRVLSSLGKRRIAGEHFDLNPLEAVFKVRNAMPSRRAPIFLDKHLEKKFLEKVEENRKNMPPGFGR